MSRERFISDLTKNGAFSKEEAEELADQEFGGKPSTPQPVSPYDPGAAASELARSQGELTGDRPLLHKGLGDMWSSLGDMFGGLSKVEKAAVAGGLGLTAASSLYGLYSARQKMKERQIKNAQKTEIDRTIDIPMDAGPAPTTEAPPKPMLSERDMEMIRQSEANKAAKEAEAAAKAATAKTPMAPKQEFVGPLQNDFMGPRLPRFVGPPESDIQGPPKPMAPPEAPKVEAPPVSGTSAETEKPAPKKRGPKSAEQKAAEATALEQKIASMEDRLPSAPNPKKSNKLLPTDVIGQGGWHWYQGQMGPDVAEENWLRQFGRTNQPYVDVKQAVKEGRLPGPVVTEGKKGGAFPRQPTVPGYIKGAASPGALAPLAALSAALGISVTPEAQAAMQKAAGAIKDIGVSPDLLQGKGEELGRLGSAYVSAGNPSYRAQLLAEMKNETNPDRYKILVQEYQKAGGNVAGGRGVAPPVAYMR